MYILKTKLRKARNITIHDSTFQITQAPDKRDREYYYLTITPVKYKRLSTDWASEVQVLVYPAGSRHWESNAAICKPALLGFSRCFYFKWIKLPQRVENSAALVCMNVYFFLCNAPVSCNSTYEACLCAIYETPVLVILHLRPYEWPKKKLLQWDG